MFGDFAHPSTIAALLVEAALFGLAATAAFLGILVRPVRRLARGLAAVTLVLGLLGVAGMVMELWTVPMPFVRRGAPLGTYAQMTQLGLLLGVFTGGLTALGSMLAFRRPGLGGLLLALMGFFGLLDEARKALQDPTLPRPSLIFGILLQFFVLAVGALVLATRWAERTGPRHARPTPRHSGIAQPQPHMGGALPRSR